MRTLAFAILTLVPLGPAAAQSHEEFVSDYCLTCHNDEIAPLDCNLCHVGKKPPGEMPTPSAPTGTGG